MAYGSSRVIFATKRVSETKLLSFDFAADMEAGETILGKAVVATVYSGTDATPSAIIDGAATSSGSEVTQSVTDGTAGVQYALSCSVATSLGQTLILQAFLTVESD